MPPPTARTSLEPSLTSVGAARRFVRDVLITRKVEALVVDTVALLTSEVVTNALLHARTAEELVISLKSSRVRIEVTDTSPDPPVRRTVELEAAWGVEPDGTGGKRVWFEVGRGGFTSAGNG
jgi:anti-sigma regulatory factor (Ser/Thr protein kinase)